MMKAILFASLPILSALAAIEPLEPAPGSVYKAGGTCSISWKADDSGKWTTMNIQLMTGENNQMVHLTTVATLDGTKETSFTYDCPEVDPNAAIYFYQFTSAEDRDNTSWTGRFAISDDSGATTNPTETTDGIAWGTGALVNAGSATPPPAYLSGGGTTGGTNSTTVSGTGTTTGGNSTTSSTSSTSVRGALTATGTLTTSLVTSVPTTSPRSSNPGTSSTNSANSSNSSSDAGSGASSLIAGLQARGLQAFVGLVGTAFVFTTLL